MAAMLLMIIHFNKYKESIRDHIKSREQERLSTPADILVDN